MKATDASYTLKAWLIIKSALDPVRNWFIHFIAMGLQNYEGNGCYLYTKILTDY